MDFEKLKMDFEKLKKERIEYNEKLIRILNIIIQRYPSMRLGQVLYAFGFTTKENKIFDTFNEEPKITYQRVIEQTKTNAELYNLIIDNI